MVTITDQVVDAAGVDYWGPRVVFRFKTGKTSIRGYAVNLLLAGKVIIEALCLASYLECRDEAEKTGASRDGLDAECRLAYKDCIGNPEAFKQHAELLYHSYQRRLEEYKKNRGGRRG